MEGGSCRGRRLGHKRLLPGGPPGEAPGDPAGEASAEAPGGGPPGDPSGGPPGEAPGDPSGEVPGRPLGEFQVRLQVGLHVLDGKPGVLEAGQVGPIAAQRLNHASDQM